MCYAGSISRACTVCDSPQEQGERSRNHRGNCGLARAYSSATHWRPPFATNRPRSARGHVRAASQDHSQFNQHRPLSWWSRSFNGSLRDSRTYKARNGVQPMTDLDSIIRKDDWRELCEDERLSFKPRDVYFVWTKQGRRPSVAHKSAEVAIAEAMRLAQKYSSRSFLVLHCIYKVNTEIDSQP